jgi:hypothetical protein
MASKNTDPYVSLGEFIKRQRELAQLSVRQLPISAGFNHLSQIERSADAQQHDFTILAKGLRFGGNVVHTSRHS